jgi:hypothetical protein
MNMILRVQKKKEEAQLSIGPKRGQTIDLYINEGEGILHANCQSRSAKLSTFADPSSPWGPTRMERVGDVCRGR